MQWVRCSFISFIFIIQFYVYSEGGKPGSRVKCLGCKGQGIKIQLKQFGPGMLQQTQRQCDDCHGEGEMVNESDRCKTCKGKRVVNETKILEVHVDKGMTDRQKIVLRKEGDQLPSVEPGDVIIIINQKPHEHFQRNGNDLVITKTITLTEALCGFEMYIKHLDGRDILVKNKPGEVIAPGKVFGVIGEGMPMYKNPFEKGNLYIKFNVEFPEKHFAPEAQLKEFETLLPERTESVDLKIGDEMVEEVDLHDYDTNERVNGRADRGEAYDSDDEEGGRGPGIQCAGH